MSSSVGAIGPVANATVYTPATSANTKVDAALAAQSTLPSSSSTATAFTSRLVVDPVAGVITEYLDSTGNVREQLPSSTVVAYLKAGLTAEGFSKTSTVKSA